MVVSLMLKNVGFLVCVLFPFADVDFLDMQDDTYTEEIRAWQVAREEKLRAERGWLSLVGRYPLRTGTNTIGSGVDNDIVFPKELPLDAPACMGTITVNPTLRDVQLELASGVVMQAGNNEEFSGKRSFQLTAVQRDWVWLGPLSMHVMERNGEYFLRIAHSDAKTRTDFPGCIWYKPDPSYRVQAAFVAHGKDTQLTVPSIIDDVTQEPSPGYAEFQIDGTTYRLDAIQEGAGLFFVFRDATAGDTTYGAARFIDIEKAPQPGSSFTLDFNKAYNPPCAFSTYTVCPLPPKQNILPIRIEAGEKFRKQK